MRKYKVLTALCLVIILLSIGFGIASVATYNPPQFNMKTSISETSNGLFVIPIENYGYAPMLNILSIMQLPIFIFQWKF